MGPRFNGVEDLKARVCPYQRTSASMGPRFNGVEDHLIRDCANIGVNASMGPRFNGVEDWGEDGAALSRRRLQWGHALMAWKTRRLMIASAERSELQWGHALMAWKTRSVEQSGWPRSTSFNGATL